jgi:hypothetical protein
LVRVSQSDWVASFLAPIIAGFLFQAGYGLAVVAVIMGLGSTMAAIVLLMLKMRAEPSAVAT